MSIDPNDLKFWAGLVAAACIALTGASVVPHPYDKVVIGLGAVAGAICTYLITPPTKESK